MSLAHKEGFSSRFRKNEGYHRMVNNYEYGRKLRTLSRLDSTSKLLLFNVIDSCEHEFLLTNC